MKHVSRVCYITCKTDKFCSRHMYAIFVASLWQLSHPSQNRKTEFHEVHPNYLIVNQACADLLVFLTWIEKDFNAPYVSKPTIDRGLETSKGIVGHIACLYFVSHKYILSSL